MVSGNTSPTSVAVAVGRLGASWDLFGPSWGVWGHPWGRPGAVLEPPGAVLVLGPLGGRHGASWTVQGPLDGPEAVVGPSKGRLTGKLSVTFFMCSHNFIHY